MTLFAMHFDDSYTIYLSAWGFDTLEKYIAYSIITILRRRLTQVLFWETWMIGYKQTNHWLLVCSNTQAHAVLPTLLNK